MSNAPRYVSVGKSLAGEGFATYIGGCYVGVVYKRAPRKWKAVTPQGVQLPGLEETRSDASTALLDEYNRSGLDHLKDLLKLED